MPQKQGYKKAAMESLDATPDSKASNKGYKSVVNVKATVAREEIKR